MLKFARVAPKELRTLVQQHLNKVMRFKFTSANVDRMLAMENMWSGDRMCMYLRIIVHDAN